MGPIPDRTALSAMLRPEIQKLCKDNNIKANMRTEEMIDALCSLATGKDVSRTQRSTSVRTASQSSRPPSRASVKAQDSVPPKKALQASEPNTDAESAPDTATPPAPTTRRKAREIQTHLGKGRPALAGGSGARAITKRKKTSAAIARRPDPIPEEDEEHAPGSTAETPDAPVKSRPASPAQQLPTPTPSHPSHSLPSAHQVAALEARLASLEAAVPAPNSALQARLRELEASATTLATRLDAATQHTARVEAESMQHATRLGTEIERLVAENGALKERVGILETRLQAQEPHQGTKVADIARPTTPRGKRIGSIIIHSPGREDIREVRPGSPAAPSPALPTLGKRPRNDDTPDGGDADVDIGEEHVRPMRKRARVDSGRKTDMSFTGLSFAQGGGGPSSTSTPRARRSDSPPGFFTVGRRAPTPLARRADDVDVDVDLDAYINLDPESEHAAGPSSAKSPGAGPSKSPGSSTAAGAPAGFFGSPPPVFFTPGTGGTLPYPLRATPSPPAPEMYATPALGAPWRHTPPPPTPTHPPAAPHPSTPPAPHDPGAGYTFRGGRRERNDRYNPYFTPGAAHRTGLTPPPVAGLGSPAKVEEGAGGEERLRTLYGTELDGDMRFGDFGRVLGRWEWAAGGKGAGRGDKR